RFAIPCRQTRPAAEKTRSRDRPLRTSCCLCFCRQYPAIGQQALLEQGRARVSARIGSKGCADLLLTAERAARGARLGLWADPNFAPLRSENLDRIAAARGQFALVEGKVLSVRESGATIYLNFGRRWTHDFTVTILKRHRRAFATAGIDPKRLEGCPIPRPGSI